jgi:hypothetical protein
MSRNDDWVKDSTKWRGHPLTGIYSHWCMDWDELPIDETCPEFPCACFRTRWSRIKWVIVEWWLRVRSRRLWSIEGL